jgi:hypothetical protein
MRAVEDADATVVRADPVLRRRVLIGCLAIVLIGVAAIDRLPASMHEIFRLARESPAAAERRARLLMLLLLGPMTVFGGVAGGATVSTAVRALRARRFPPPGARVLRDTPIVRGRTARVIASLALVLGVTLVCASGALGWFGWRAAATLRNGCPRAARVATASLPRGSSVGP